MKIKLTQGCICYAFTANDKPFTEMNDEQLIVLLSRMARTIAFKWREKELEDWRKFELIGLLRDLTENFPDTETHSQPCECCGDIIDDYTLELY